MASTLRQLAIDMRALAAELPEKASNAAVEVARAVHTDLVQVTPVDTGQAMSNWQVAVGRSFIDTQNAFVPSPRGKMVAGRWTHTVDPQITHQNNVGPATDAAETALRTKRPGEAITITNNLPYIQRLDDGYSEQTPAGFVDRALILAESVAKNSKVVG